MSVVKDSAGDVSLLRIALPGAAAAVGIHPIVAAVAPWAQARFGIDTILLLSVEILVLGLTLSLLSRFVIMIYEGFRLPMLTTWLWKFQRRRIRLLQRRLLS